MLLWKITPSRGGVMNLVRLLGLERSIGFRLLREECGHCKGKGRCHSGRGESYGISCASCQMAALGKTGTELVRCEPCEGRGLYVFTIPEGQALERVMLEMLPQA